MLLGLPNEAGLREGLSRVEGSNRAAVVFKTFDLQLSAQTYPSVCFTRLQCRFRVLPLPCMQLLSAVCNYEI